MIDALRRHWPEYLIEAGGLGVFMIVASVSGALTEYPGSALRHALPQAWFRRIVMGLAMGLTAMALIDSPFVHRCIFRCGYASTPAEGQFSGRPGSE